MPNILKIHTYGDAVLRQTSSPVESITPDLLALSEDMLETMYNSNGVGLSAVQVGVPKRLVVIDIEWPHGEKKPMVIFNPELMEYNGSYMDQEGCLSIPGIYCNILRYRNIKLRYLDKDGKSNILDATDYLAKCIQHEMDHLNGILFVDKISQTEKVLLAGKLKKISRGL
jgi:peptide deformylase